MLSKNDFQKALDLIVNSKNILITAHTRPDGDACGSIAALYEVLTATGRGVTPLLLGQVPDWYAFLFTEKPAVFGENVTVERLKGAKSDEHDLIIIVDTNTNNQLPGFSDYLKDADKPVLVIDHHVTADGLGDVELIDTGAAATAMIVFDLIKHAEYPITEKIATALFVAIATDTGWFQFSNTDSRVLRDVAELIAAGANPTKLYHNLYQNFSIERFKLMTAMLNTLELQLDGRYAVQHLLQSDFAAAGANQKDTENLINECRRISTVEAAALFVELPDGKIKCSLRSTGSVDVRRIAQKFGGGGHTMASGLHLPGSMKDAKKLIYNEIQKQLPTDKT